MHTSQNHTSYKLPTESVDSKIARNKIILSQLSTEVYAATESMQSFRSYSRRLDSQGTQAILQGYALTLSRYACRLAYQHLLHHSGRLSKASSVDFQVYPQLPYIQGLPESAEWSTVRLQQMAHLPEPKRVRGRPPVFTLNNSGPYTRNYLERKLALPSIQIGCIPKAQWQHTLDRTAASEYHVKLDEYHAYLNVTISL